MARKLDQEYKRGPESRINVRVSRILRGKFSDFCARYNSKSSKVVVEFMEMCFTGRVRIIIGRIETIPSQMRYLTDEEIEKKLYG